MQRTVLVVEDQALMSALLSEALAGAGFHVECAADAASALEAARDCDPDAVILDIDLGPGPTGFDVGRTLAQTRPHIAVLYLTDRPELAPAALDGQSGGSRAGFLLKRRVRDMDTLIAAVEAVLADQPEHARQDDVLPGRLPELDERQMVVLRMVAQGLTNAAIAQRMGASESSVERWLVKIFRALGIETHKETNARVAATRRYIAACGLPD